MLPKELGTVAEVAKLLLQAFGSMAFPGCSVVAEAFPFLGVEAMRPSAAIIDPFQAKAVPSEVDLPSRVDHPLAVDLPSMDSEELLQDERDPASHLGNRQKHMFSPREGSGEEALSSRS